jgi:glucosamine--fructose-6-phosphate aminotransferase (isomerizing)
MCGIIAILRRRADDRAVPTGAELLAMLDPVPALLAAARTGGSADDLAGAGARLAELDTALRGVTGVRALLADRALVAALETRTAAIGAQVADLERTLDAGAIATTDLEEFNAALVRSKDALWAVRHDRLRAAEGVADLAGPGAGPAAVAGFLSIHQALSALDRLEVRGRDSAGLAVTVRHHDLDLDGPALAPVIAERGGDMSLGDRSVRTPDGLLVLVYKAAAEIGELGDNTRSLRASIRDDPLLHQALAGADAEVAVLGHTRWASVGIVSQANAHPLDSGEVDGSGGPFVTAVLNGDVDNFADLKATAGLRIPTEITTDAKVIPTLASRHLASGDGPLEAFRATASALEGSVAVAASTASAPGDLLLALRGSGQALYVGLADDAYIVASEPYGVVEETDRYLRMDGESANEHGNPASRGQLIRLVGQAAGTVEGIERMAYDGTPLSVVADELTTAQITTRDIDRGTFPHYLLKEISEAPASFRKTLRGKLVDVGGRLDVTLGDDVVPSTVVDRLADGTIKRVLVIGQGTAAVAGQSLLHAFRVAAPTSELSLEALPATELSGFDLRDDMRDTLVVAISQSGTTTDTNRTVDLVRARGGTVIAIVNRRNSDLTDKADGVLYTSDGRDVEMSVASTKAFYAQIAACFLLAFGLADAAGAAPGVDRDVVLRDLRALPDAMERALGLRTQVAEAAHRFAPSRRYWAVVGNGVNRIAAQEVRIKLSELCYKSIACDATEDKKHIDLSAEPLIVVCAAGLAGSTADDVAKEVAIYRAHKAAPIVIASEGEERFGAALAAVLVPPTHPSLAFVLSAMAGHLFGYEAALAIDAQARPLREARAAIEAAISTAPGAVVDAEEVQAHLAPMLGPIATRFFDGLRAGEFDGHLEAGTAVRLTSLLRYALGVTDLDAYQIEFGRVGTPSVVIEDLTAALTRAIDELTRPVDAIKHQAKTVTVGISRSDETLLQVPLVRSVLEAGVARDRLSYQALRTLAALEPLVYEVLGYTRYRIDGRLDDPDVEPTAVVVDRGGLGRELRSRTEDNPVLRGTKHRVAIERQVVVARGRSDGRTVLIVPEVKDTQTTGLTLLHIGLADDLPLAALRAVLQGYRNRYASLRDAVTETEPTFRDDLLIDVPIVELMTDPISDLADRWRS